MPYAPFHEKFPDVAGKETRAITVLNLPGLPAGEYGLVESYCNEPGCDCRRVFLSVINSRGHMLAVIAFGWEGKDFYAKWMGTNDPDRVRGLQGPCLNLFSPQSPLAPALLELVQAVLKDQAYVARLKRHYHMYRQKIEEPPNTSSSDPPGRAR